MNSFDEAFLMSSSGLEGSVRVSVCVSISCCQPAQCCFRSSPHFCWKLCIRSCLYYIPVSIELTQWTPLRTAVCGLCYAWGNTEIPPQWCTVPVGIPLPFPDAHTHCITHKTGILLFQCIPLLYVLCSHFTSHCHHRNYNICDIFCMSVFIKCPTALTVANLSLLPVEKQEKKTKNWINRLHISILLKIY